MKKFYIIIGIQFILMIGFLIFSVIQKMEADRQRQIATQERFRADQQEQLAKMNAFLAQQQKLLAEEQSKTARTQTVIADEQSNLKSANPDNKTYQKEIVRLAFQNQNFALENDSLKEVSKLNEERLKRYTAFNKQLRAQVKGLKDMLEDQGRIIDSLRAN